MTTVNQTEMHPSRWGDPARAAALPAEARGLVEHGLRRRRPARRTAGAARAVRDRPRTCSPKLAGILGAEHVRTDDDTRRLRTRGKSTPDLLRARSGDLSDAPDAVVRPSSHEEVAAVLDLAVEHHLAVVPFGGGTSVTGGLVARREGFAGVLSLDLVRMKRLLVGRPRVDDRDPRARPARPRGRGAARRRGPDPRPLPAVLRVRLDRRLRRDPLQRPVQRRLRPVRRARRRADRRHPARPGRPRQRSGQRRRAGPAPAVPRLRGHLRRDHRGDRAGAQGSPRSRSTRAGAGRRSPTARPRCAPSPSPG